MRKRLSVAALAVLTARAAAPEGVLPGAAPFDPALAALLTAEWAARPAGYVPRTRHLEKDGSPRYTNRLFLETSPYLRQHAHNPVNWYPWGEEAFAAARRLGRPVLLSVGYATCHWCHVMEEESFEDVEIARVLNEGYVAVKVDREERPDVDALYMTAVRAMGGQGGWPLTVWLTAERQPFFAGTYFPPRDGDRGLRKGLLSLLREMRELHSAQGERVAETAASVTDAVRDALGTAPAGTGSVDAAALRAAMAACLAEYDAEWGGFKGPLKFPGSMPLRFLLRYHRRTGDAEALAMAVHTLEKMAQGGIHDQVGGGFHRYAVDPRWEVPHFEKMLYDNATLAVTYLEAHQATGRADLAEVARGILEHLERDLASPEGAFFSATDADSPAGDGRREEGLYFTWTRDELRAALGASDAAFLEALYGVSGGGNFEGRSVLWMRRPLAELARERGLDEASARATVARGRAALRADRARRPPPLRDEKVLAAWNGLAVSAFARAASVLGEPAYAARAARAADFVLSRMREGPRLLRSFARGRARHPAYLEDYAFLIAGLIDLYEAGGEPRWLEEAQALDRVLERHFEDQGSGGYFATSDDHEPLLTRMRPPPDGAEPSGNSVQALNLLRLHELSGDDRYRQRAERALGAAAGFGAAPEAFAELLVAADFRLDTPKQVVIVAPKDRAQAEPLLRELRRRFVPNRVVAVAVEGPDLVTQARFVPLLEGKLAREGQATAYVCERRVCERPTGDPHVFAAQLAKVEPLARPATPEARALAYLMREVPGWRRKNTCGSCHNNGDGARALFRARDLGHTVPAATLLDTLDWLGRPKEWEKESGPPGTSDTKLARIQFAAAQRAAAAAGLLDDAELLRKTAAALAREQDKDGGFRIGGQTSLGSPVAYGPFVATWLARDTLAAAGETFAREASRAEGFFLANPPRNVMDAAATALALAGAVSEAARARRQEALDLLAGAEAGGGGFGPYRGSAPEPFDTALALLALKAAGGDAHRDLVRRGRAYLRRVQLDTGGFPETTRPAGYESYAQHVSTTAWAALALLETAPDAAAAP